MDHDGTDSMPTRIAALCERIDHWRETRKKHSRMPDELWLEAVELASTESIYTVARAAKLDYAKLKWLVEEQEVDDEDEHDNGDEERATFVEVDLASLPALGEVSVEVSRVDGAELRLRIPLSSSLDLAGLITAFVSGGR